MLVAAQAPTVALHTRSQTQTVTGQRRQHVDAYHAPPVPGPVMMHPPPLKVSPVPMSIPLPVPVAVQMPVQVPVQLPVVVPLPVPVHQKVGEPVVVPPQERLLAAQLAHLASQHHTSDYNRLKFGQRGSPNAYLPLSLQAPGHVRELRAKQARDAGERAWWISERTGCDPQVKPSCSVVQAQISEQTLSALVTGPSLDVSQEIFAAISSQMVTTHITKTSESHPINISMVIPSEAMPGIASRLVQSPTPSPIMFHLPENCHLYRITAALMHGPFYRTGNPLYLPAVRPPVSVTWTQQGSADLENALNAKLAFPPPRLPFVPSWEQYTFRPLEEIPPCTFPMPDPTPPSPPRGVVRRRQRLGRAKSAPPSLRNLSGVQRRVPSHKELRQCLPRNRSSPEVPKKRLDYTPSGTPRLTLPSDSDRPEQIAQEDRLSNNANGYGLMLPPPSVIPSLSPPTASIPNMNVMSPDGTAPMQRLGNMYLSSCPGKKVRLSGPVKGRGAICRDLQADLSRMKELGVGCVICCLDDNELDFLGASWIEYSSVANELGLDVLRIPTPEGLAPLSPASLDVHLKQVIETYTLRGIPVLAHCRGGVGRAGLVACCWMIRLGLVGWKDQQICVRACSEHSYCRRPSRAGHSPQTGNGQEQTQTETQHHQAPTNPFMPNHHSQSFTPPLVNVPRVCRATLHLVERVLAVIRRRRSLKAVETFEQVRFIVDFVEYLDAEASRQHDIQHTLSCLN